MSQIGILEQKIADLEGKNFELDRETHNIHQNKVKYEGLQNELFETQKKLNDLEEINCKLKLDIENLKLDLDQETQQKEEIQRELKDILISQKDF